jgi:glycosyltransferase involved in cell wall biosynthesis
MRLGRRIPALKPNARSRGFKTCSQVATRHECQGIEFSLMSIVSHRNVSAERVRVLVLLGSFWPGHYANGPHQSLIAYCTALKAEYDFMVVARDRAFGGNKALVDTDTWIDLEFAHFRYRNIRMFGAAGLGKLMCDTPHDIVVLNGFFDPEFTLPALVARRLGRIPRRPMILSPRGEFSAGALALKAFKKKPYLTVVTGLRLLDDVWLHATDDTEREDIYRALPGHNRIVVAPNVRILNELESVERLGGSGLNFAFLSRIDRKKNLDYALEVLRTIRFDVNFDIYGPVTDENYWRECQALMATMPNNIRVHYLGPLSHEAVTSKLAKYDALFLPTRGENYGHAIIDALEAGVPVLISDRTPWQNLERIEAGWSLPLDAPESFRVAIRQLRDMDSDNRKRFRIGSRRLAERIVAQSDAVARTRAMFELAMAADFRQVRDNASRRVS